MTPGWLSAGYPEFTLGLDGSKTLFSLNPGVTREPWVTPGLLLGSKTGHWSVNANSVELGAVSHDSSPVCSQIYLGASDFRKALTNTLMNFSFTTTNKRRECTFHRYIDCEFFSLIHRFSYCMYLLNARRTLCWSCYTVGDCYFWLFYKWRKPILIIFMRNTSIVHRTETLFDITHSVRMNK